MSGRKGVARLHLEEHIAGRRETACPRRCRPAGHALPSGDGGAAERGPRGPRGLRRTHDATGDRRRESPRADPRANEPGTRSAGGDADRLQHGAVDHGRRQARDLRRDRHRKDDGGRSGGRVQDASGGDDEAPEHARRLPLPPASRRTLRADAEGPEMDAPELPKSLADKLLLQYDEWDIVSKYEDYVATGKPLDVHDSLGDDATWERYQRGMRALASNSAGEVARRLPVPAGATTMLDIGGSHGYYSVCACRRHAGLR